MNKRFLGLSIFVILLNSLIIYVGITAENTNIFQLTLFSVIGFATWVIGHFLSFYVAKALFQIQRLSLFHLHFNSFLISYDDFFIVSRKRNKFWSFLIITLISFFLSIFISSSIMDFLDPNLEDDENISDSDNLRYLYDRIWLSLGLIPIISILLYAIYIIDFSNLRVSLVEKKIISSASSSFRVLFGGFTIYLGGFSFYEQFFQTFLDYGNDGANALFGFILVLILFSTNISLSFMFLHFSEEKLTKKFQLYLNSLGITEKEYHIK